MANEEPTKEFPVYVGQAQVPIPTTAIPYTEPTLQIAPPRRRRGLFVVGLLATGLILCAFGVVAGIAFFGPGSGDSDTPEPGAGGQTTAQQPPAANTQGPRQATERFLAAVLDGNQQAINENLCALLRNDGQNDNSGGLGLAFLIGYKVGEAKLTGPTATVNVELQVPILDPIRFDIYLLQEQGGWRVCGGGPTG